MKILCLGEDENVFHQIERNLYEGEIICWHRLHDLELNFNIEEFDIVILDSTNVDLDISYYVIKLNCHLTKPVLVLVENVSVTMENRIWGVGVADIIKLPFTEDECRQKIDCAYRWKWYYDRCKDRSETCTY